jgi:hypothetical protein
MSDCIQPSPLAAGLEAALELVLARITEADAEVHRLLRILKDSAADETAKTQSAGGIPAVWRTHHMEASIALSVAKGQVDALKTVEIGIYRELQDLGRTDSPLASPDSGVVS